MIDFEILPGRKVGKGQPCFIIAEIGQNHQGDINIAKKLIQTALECGADCVKFQKSDLTSRFNKYALNRPYTSPNSFGVTYGEHRKFLEFSTEEFIDLASYASQIGIPFTASGMDKPSIDFLCNLNVPFLKIGSGDANNLPLLTYAASLQKPLVVSTGMQELTTVCKVYNSLRPLNNRLGILQCTSAYPTPPKDVNLKVIKVYQKMFPETVIGYSGHECGIGISIAAVAFGAKIIERHLTLDHTWKGSDHKASLEPHEFKQLVYEIQNVEQAIISSEKRLQESERACYEKLAKTVVTTRNLPSGTILQEDMLDIKVAEPKGSKAENITDLVGKKLIRTMNEDESILEEYLS